jgi:hypothetical protein
MKTTNKIRRLLAQVRQAKLMKAMADDPRKPGYVSKQAHTKMRDANRTKGLPFSRCAVIEFETADPSIGKPGAILIQRRSDASALRHRVPARNVPHLIPAPMRALMGL